MNRRWLYLFIVPFFLLILFAVARKIPAPADSEISQVDAPILGRTLHHIERNYVDHDLISPLKLLDSALKELEITISPFLARVEESGIFLKYANKSGKIPVPSPLSMDDLHLLLRKTLGFLNVNYKGQLTLKEIEYAAARGLTNGLDVHSTFLPPKMYQEFRISTKGRFGGLGIVIGIREGHLTVISPLEDTPAWKGGIQASDRIIQINEEPTINMSLTEAVEKLRGPIGSKVTILVERTGQATPQKFTLKRDLIEIHSVAGRFIKEGDVGLMKIKNFQEDTVPSFERLLHKMQKENPTMKGLILDLRNNPGGLLDQAVELADRFLSHGTIVKTVGPEISENEEAEEGDMAEKIPLVVLVNEGSASASEIIAGTFQNNDRALTLGARTFGKGTVQTIYDLRDDSALKLTIAKYLTAGDREVQSIGILPDIELLPVVVGKEQINYYEDPVKREGERTDFPMASLRLRYLKPVKEKKETDDDESYKIGLEEDFPILLAQELLQLPQEVTALKSSWLQKVSSLVNNLRQQQLSLIEEALQTRKIDWGLSEAKGDPSLSAKINLKDKDGIEKKSFRPGDEGRLVMTVENKGDGTFYQLGTVSESEDPLFDGLEFLFGRLAPGEQKQWEVPIKIPESSLPRSEPIHFRFEEGYGRVPKSIALNLHIEEIPHPIFAYQYEIRDGNLPGTQGNRNGRPDPGETVAIRLQIQNLGEGKSIEPVVNIKNLGGTEVFIEKGRALLKTLAPHKRDEATLMIHIARKFNEKNPKVSLALSVSDKFQSHELEDRLKFPLTPKEALVPSTGEWQIPPLLGISSMPLRVEKKSYLLEGLASDDKKVQHFFVFVGATKEIYLSPLQQDPHSFPFKTKLKLKEGMNVITAVAQDDRELTTRRRWIVWRD
ncbi:MAG: PDZ domain-containing protein [Deltaproteobacteria bacterium]|nr:PDZ domain-containing protein [Deltaproteobacteria bacterium]